MSGVVGFITNVVAVQMTFYPIKMWPLSLWAPKGSPIGILGWQGIIPAKADKMARILTDMLMTKVFDINEVFRRVPTDLLIESLQPTIVSALPRLVNLAATSDPTLQDLWISLPTSAKEEVIKVLLPLATPLLQNFMDDFSKQVSDTFDLIDMAELVASENPRKIVQIFQDVGNQEFRFLERSGLWFGILFGVPQVIVNYWYNPWWWLPLMGFFVGYATNWVALKLIFEPVKPRDCKCFVLHGAFLKRQQEVSVAFAKCGVEIFFCAKNIWRGILDGAKRKKFEALLTRHVDAFIDETAGPALPALKAYVGTAEQWSRLKLVCAKGLLVELRGGVEATYDVIDTHLGLESQMAEELAAMPPEDFINVLRPAFVEDEFKLILIGGVLGVACGFFTAFVIFQETIP
mmetsp:Transcript_7136/g.26250  ORF Transcript_7136/g.26250 Transcript_7136/m.26250 type:complete len:404 (-) Transcript_7136:66-1277(-)